MINTENYAAGLLDGMTRQLDTRAKCFAQGQPKNLDARACAAAEIVNGYLSRASVGSNPEARQSLYRKLCCAFLVKEFGPSHALVSELNALQPGQKLNQIRTLPNAVQHR